MFNIVLGFVGAVTLSIIAPDKFAAVSKFLRSLPPRVIALLKARQP